MVDVDTWRSKPQEWEDISDIVNNFWSNLIVELEDARTKINEIVDKS